MLASDEGNPRLYYRPNFSTEPTNINGNRSVLSNSSQEQCSVPHVHILVNSQGDYHSNDEDICEPDLFRES